MEEEKKTPEREEEQALPVQELPTDIPAEVRQKLAEDLNEQATEDLKQDVREAEKEEANDEEVKANPEMLTKSRLLKLLVKKQYVKLREVTEEEQPADLAELLEELDENNRLVVFRLLKKDVATEAFAYMSDEARDDLVNAFSDVELVSAIEDMSLDDAADLLEDMPAGVVKRVLEKSSRQTRESLNKLLNYPESSAGSLMTPEYVRLRQDMTVSDAFTAIRKQGENAETVYTCYVVERNRLLGVVSARSLLLSDPSTPIVDIMDDNVVTVKVTDDQEFVAREMQRYDFTAMPVLDNEGMFVGIITIDDAIDVLTDESTEDMQKMAAILPDDDATTYFGTSVWTHAKQRIPWLLILMLSATFTGMVTTHYEEAFVSLPLLVSFMPMLMDTAGNCGNQISTLMVRGLALGEVEPSDFLKVLGKELRVSAIVGAAGSILPGVGALVVTGPMLYAQKYAFLAQAREGRGIDLNDLFRGFRDDFGGTLLISLLSGLFIFLWSLLLFIPGIVKAYAYSMVYYVKADHPEYGWRECLDESQHLMTGHKWEKFVLDLSFIGWGIVGSLCLGVGTLWVMTYMAATEAQYYEYLTSGRTSPEF